MRKIRISAGKVQITAELNDTKTADLLWEALPIQAAAQRWGDEVYFDIGIAADEEDPRATVPSGTIAYWPPGTAFCIFFGQTPASPVNVLGRVEGDATAIAEVRHGEDVRLEPMD